MSTLDKELFDVSLDGVNLGLELGAVLLGDGGSDDRSGDSASSAESLLGSDENVRDILVLAEKWQMEQNLERLGVGGHDNELGDASVQRLGGFVGTFSELLVVSRLLHQIQDRLGQVRIGQRVRFWVYFIHILCLGSTLRSQKITASPSCPFC